MFSHMYYYRDSNKSANGLYFVIYVRTFQSVQDTFLRSSELHHLHLCQNANYEMLRQCGVFKPIGSRQVVEYRDLGHRGD